MLEDVCSEAEPDKDETIVDYRVYAFPKGSVDASDFNRRMLKSLIASGELEKRWKEMKRESSICYAIYRFFYEAITAD